MSEVYEVRVPFTATELSRIHSLRLTLLSERMVLILPQFTQGSNRLCPRDTAGMTHKNRRFPCAGSRLIPSGLAP
jgi:hypothetical protein